MCLMSSIASCKHWYQLRSRQMPVQGQLHKLQDEDILQISTDSTDIYRFYRYLESFYRKSFTGFKTTEIMATVHCSFTIYPLTVTI